MLIYTCQLGAISRIIAQSLERKNFFLRIRCSIEMWNFHQWQWCHFFFCLILLLCPYTFFNLLSWKPTVHTFQGRLLYQILTNSAVFVIFSAIFHCHLLNLMLGIFLILPGIYFQPRLGLVGCNCHLRWFETSKFACQYCHFPCRVGPWTGFFCWEGTGVGLYVLRGNLLCRIAVLVRNNVYLYKENAKLATYSILASEAFTRKNKN